MYSVVELDDLDNLQTLISAIHSGKTESLYGYLKDGGNPNACYGMTLLAHSVNASNLPAVKLLVEAGAEVNFGGKNGRFPLYVASKSSLTHSTEIMQLLLEHGARLDSRYINGNTALLESVSAGDVSKVALLIAAGADLQSTNYGGDTALHMSALRGSFDITKMLLDAGMSPMVLQYNGRSTAPPTGTQPLHMTAFGLDGGFGDVAGLLLNAGADVNATEQNGRTVLHHVAIRNAHRVLKVLLQFKCNLDPISNENGEHKTPLMKAIESRHSSMVARLISAGARLDIPDCWGTPPLLAAVFSGDPATVSVLVQSGCDVDESLPGNPLVNPLAESLCRALSITVMLVTAGCEIRRALRPQLHQTPDSLTDRMRWLNEVASLPFSLQGCARRVIRRRLGLLKCHPSDPIESARSVRVDGVLDKLELLRQSGFPQRICDYIRCTELDDVLTAYES